MAIYNFARTADDFADEGDALAWFFEPDDTCAVETFLL